MNLYKKIIAIQLVLILQIFASDPLSGEDGAIKDSSSEAFIVLSAGIADIGQLVDINTGYPTQNGWVQTQYSGNKGYVNQTQLASLTQAQHNYAVTYVDPNAYQTDPITGQKVQTVNYNAPGYEMAQVLQDNNTKYKV